MFFPRYCNASFCQITTILHSELEVLEQSESCEPADSRISVENKWVSAFKKNVDAVNEGFVFRLVFGFFFL